MKILDLLTAMIVGIVGLMAVVGLFALAVILEVLPYFLAVWFLLWFFNFI